MIDGLDEYRLQETTTFELDLPAGGQARAPTGETDADGEPIFELMTITVRRMSSGPVQKYLNSRKNAQLRTIKRAQKISAESIEEEAVALLAFCVISWTGFRSNGKPLDCNRLNVSNLISDKTLVWIREQVDSAIGDDTGYLGNS